MTVPGGALADCRASISVQNSRSDTFRLMDGVELSCPGGKIKSFAKSVEMDFTNLSEQLMLC